MLNQKKLDIKMLESLNEIIKIVSYNDVQITWSSTSNPFVQLQKDVTIAGYRAVAFGYSVIGAGSSFATTSAAIIGRTNNVDTLSLFLRMIGSNPASTTQNKVNLSVVYVKESVL